MPIRDGRPINEKQLALDISKIIAQHALTLIRPDVPSKTLQEAMRVRVSKGAASVYIPHYWAVYFHDTRAAFGPRKKRWLVWFANPADDPRLQPKPPERYDPNNRLSKEDWDEGLAENLRRQAAGLPPYMIVRKRVPARTGDYFFTLAPAEKIKQAAEREIVERFEQGLAKMFPHGTQQIVIKV